MRILLLCFVIVSLSACRLALDPGDYSFTRDSGVDDSGVDDAGVDGRTLECIDDDDCMRLNQLGECVDGRCEYETCADGFGDCDGDGICETDLKTTSDCGACDISCSGVNGSPACTDGTCTIACDPDFADCGGDGDGCESSLGLAGSCGSCMTMCDDAAPLCSSDQMCVLSCGSDTQCGDSCVDVSTSALNCGDCGNACNPDPTDGSESCVGSSCVLACDVGYDDCNGARDDGCEIDLTSLSNCGACGAMCSAAEHEIATCDTSSCQLTCEFGFGDCDEDPGCETPLLNDGSNCGACGVSCDDGVMCVRGACITPMVTTGQFSGCQLSGSGAVECWGMGDAGQIGNNQFGHQTRPQPVGGLFATQISVGGQFACAVTFTGQAECWGRNQYRELGDDGTRAQSATTRVVVPGAGEEDIGVVSAVYAGESHGCLLNEAGQVWCWGRDDFGQSGDGTAGDPFGSSTKPVSLEGPATALSVGTVHSCAVVAGEVWCWGRGNSGQLGDGMSADYSAIPVRAGTGMNFVEVAAGGVHTCARTDANSVWCWGSVLGNMAGFSASSTPVEVSALAGATWIEAGSVNVCAGLPIGSACIGQNAVGQLGDGTTSDTASFLAVRPMPVAGVVTGRIWPGNRITPCAIINGESHCWGGDRYGQLGRNDDIVLPTPTAIPALEGATDLSIGYQNGCIIKEGQVWCFGQHRPGRQIRSSAPVPIAAVSNPIDIEVGFFGAAALNDLPQAYAWWTNAGDRFGGGGFSLPVLLDRAGPEQELAIGTSHFCVREGPNVFCQGLNTAGQLGMGLNMFDPVTGFVEVNLPGAAVAITSGANTMCARMADGSVRCWGDGAQGRLGNGMAENSSLPVTVMGLNRVIDIDFGRNHVCAIEAATPSDNFGRVYCWGLNNRGQLGGGPSVDVSSSTPVDTGITNAIAVTAGANHSCAILQTGEVMCWGTNQQYQVGDGTREDRSSPVMLVGLTADTTTPLIDAGEQQGDETCVLAAGGEVYCWGECASGGCARGDMYSATPAPVGTR